MMGQFEQLDQMLTAQEGMLRTSQVLWNFKAGIL